MLNLGLNVLLVLLFSMHVYFALKSFRNSRVHLMNLLRQGVVDNVFRHSRKMLYLLLIPAVLITGIATWSFYNVLTYCGASDLILYIILGTFTCYSMTVIAAFLFCKVLQLAAHKAGL
jgi:Na+/serine symporter